MKITDTPLKDAKMLSLEPFEDHRGSFYRLFCEKQIPLHFPQINLSTNKKKGTVRGLHFQKEPFAEDKVVYCLQGRVLDVIMDLRESSPTYGHHFSIELERGKALFVPKGFAHGFQTLEDNSELLYLISQTYDPKSSSGVHWRSTGVAWPLPISEISEKDQALPLFSPSKTFTQT